MFEDALDCAEKSLLMNDQENKTIILQARSLGFLRRFYEAFEVLEKVKDKTLFKKYERLIQALN